MSFPNSVEEINAGLIAEGIDSLEGFEKMDYDLRVDLSYHKSLVNKKQEGSYGYWLDNCGDDVWYCEHCLQPECNKRMAKCKRGVIC